MQQLQQARAFHRLALIDHNRPLRPLFRALQDPRTTKVCDYCKALDLFKIRFLVDEPEAKRLKLDDDEFVDEGTAEILRGANAQDEILDASQRAIDITTNFVYERLTTNVVVKLVTISLFTLPDEMPAAFQSSFTDISTAGTDVDFKNLLKTSIYLFLGSKTPSCSNFSYSVD